MACSFSKTRLAQLRAFSPIVDSDEEFAVKLSQLFLISAVIGTCSCEDKTDPNGIADRFVDAYYVEYNLVEALKLATTSAKSRIEKEQKLVANARKSGALSAARAKVYYDAPVHSAVKMDRAHHTYVLEIHASSGPITNRVLIMTAKRDGQWKVFAFRELDRGSAQENRGSSPGKKSIEAVEVKSPTSTTSTSGEQSL
jgi:hypothetical protein